MARTTLVKTVALGAYGDYSVAHAADLTMAVADVGNMNQFVASSSDLVIAHNTGASTYTVTITSIADPHYGRTKDITAYSLVAGEYAVFGPFLRPGWVQTDGYVYLQANNALVKFGVVQLPV